MRTIRSLKHIDTHPVGEMTRETLEQPRLVKFLKMGTLVKEAIPRLFYEVKMAASSLGHDHHDGFYVVWSGQQRRKCEIKTPTKVVPAVVTSPVPTKATIPSVSKMSMEQIKLSKMVAELKTLLN